MKKETAIAVAAVAAAAAGLAAVALWSRRSSRRWRRAQRIVGELKKRCATPAPKLWAVADAMVAEMKAGLASDGASSLRMIVTPQISFPTGEEEGLFYGLELRHTKARIMWVKLGGKDAGIINKEIVEVPVPSKLMIGTSQELYDYLAAELVKFFLLEDIRYKARAGNPKKIGITFSFPVVTNIRSSRIKVEWTKGFSIKEMDDRDPREEIIEALKKHDIEMHPLLVNDTVGTFAGGRYCCGDIVAAILLGSGTNAAFMEPLHSVPVEQGSYFQQGVVRLIFRYIQDLSVLVINMEWGNFQSYHFPITEFDVGLDKDSPKPGEQLFEKLISGMYLGDIVRRILLKLAEETQLFGDTVPLKLKVPFVLRTPDVACMHQDTSEDLEVVGEKLESCLGISYTTLRMRGLVVQVCDIVVKRGARLAGAGIVAILKELGRDGTDEKGVVMVEGGLYEHYRLFREYLHSSVKEMLQGRLADNVVIKHFTDSSGIGAALLAAANS